jgi:hypothetical protein
MKLKAKRTLTKGSREKNKKKIIIKIKKKTYENFVIEGLN